jgi:hypothetical protein
MGAYTVREERDERTGKHSENEAGEDRDPLHYVSSVGKMLIARANKNNAPESQLCGDLV